MRHGRIECSGEAEGLALTRQTVCDAANRGQKAHVEHAIGFVEYQDFRRAQLDQVSTEKILQTSRSRDHEIRCAQRRNLLALRCAADGESRSPQLLAAQLLILLLNLNGQFPCWHKHQRLNAGTAAVQEPFGYGNQEGKRLAGSSLCGCQQISSA